MSNVGISLNAVSAAPTWGGIVTFDAPKSNIGIQMIPSQTNGTVSVYGSLDGVTFSPLTGLASVGSGFNPSLAAQAGVPVIAARAHLDAIGTTVGSAFMTVWVTGY